MLKASHVLAYMNIPVSKTGTNTAGGIQLVSAARAHTQPLENSTHTCNLHCSKFPQLHTNKCHQIQQTANQVGKTQKPL